MDPSATGGPTPAPGCPAHGYGESDGTCNGGPAAGTFWDAYAIGLVRGA